jgi:acetolactate synthase-1/2/3 large subunit
MGVQDVHPGKRILCIMGDGALGFALAELHTLARHNVPIVVVVMNNRAWGATSHYQKKHTVFGTHDELFATNLAGADYHDVASALGCYGIVVRRTDEIRPAVRAALDSGRPACINIEIGLEDIAPDHLNRRFTD